MFDLVGGQEVAVARDDGDLGRSVKQLEIKIERPKDTGIKGNCHNSGLSVLDKSMSAIAVDGQIAWERRQRMRRGEKKSKGQRVKIEKENKTKIQPVDTVRDHGRAPLLRKK